MDCKTMVKILGLGAGTNEPKDLHKMEAFLHSRF